jgi:hypothetical protein
MMNIEVKPAFFVVSAGSASAIIIYCNQFAAQNNYCRLVVMATLRSLANSYPAYSIGVANKPYYDADDDYTMADPDGTIR